MYRTDDPLMDFDKWERQKEQLAASLPECDYCGNPVDDHYYNINGEIYCEGCLDEHFRVTVEL